MRLIMRANLIIGCILAIAADANAQTTWTPELMLQVKRVGTPRPSPDGNRVAFVVGTPAMLADTSEWVSQLWLVNADGSNAVQLTRAAKSSTAPEWSPDGKWLAFLSARSGRNQVYRIPVAGGEAEQLTTQKGSVAGFKWSPDGKSMAYTVTDPKSEDEEQADKERRDAFVVDENYKFNRLHVLNLADLKSRALNTGMTHISGFNWSPNSRDVVFTHAGTPLVFENQDVTTINMASGALTKIAATNAHESGGVYSPDGRSIAYTASDDPPTWAFTTHIYVAPATGGNARQLGKTFDEQPNVIGWSSDGKNILFSETHGTVNRLSSVAVAGGAPVTISSADVNVTAAALNATGTTAALISQWSDKPPEVFVTRLDKFAPRQVSRVHEPVNAPLGRTEAVRWKAQDGRDVEGLVTYPVGYTGGTRVPLLTIVHGGPTGVFTHSYIATPGPYPVAAFAARGYAVLRVNPRGSSGYGRDFRYANYRDWGGGDYRDIMSGIDHLVQQGVADADRLGIMGWSYGGYMTSWVITQTKRFKAASVGAGVTNLMSFTGTADIPGFIPDYMGGDFWDNFDTWRTHSAMFNIKGVSTPTLIQHGERDLRVPISQGYELYNALKRQKVPVRMVVYPRQPHGIQEPKLVLDAMHRNLEWFDRYITRVARQATP
jgi:dipeptidyl aminopeptidase/acylaminoacyl peptidase